MNSGGAMTVHARALRAYAPLLVLLLTVGAGWMAFIQPLSADQSHAAGQLATLRQRERVLRREISEPSSARGGTEGRPSPLVNADPEATFERQVASADASPALLEHLARLASTARARNLLIETVEGGAAVSGLAKAHHRDRDPRLALFDIPVSHVPIRVVFDTDYTSLGRFLWVFRNLPTAVEIRGLAVGAPPAERADAGASERADVLRVSLTLHAYSRLTPAGITASNTVAR